jgi:hypothetical protein
MPDVEEHSSGPLSLRWPRWKQEGVPSELDKKSLVAKIDLRLVGDAEEFR